MRFYKNIQDKNRIYFLYGYKQTFLEVKAYLGSGKNILSVKFKKLGYILNLPFNFNPSPGILSSVTILTSGMGISLFSLFLINRKKND